MMNQGNNNSNLPPNSGQGNNNNGAPQNSWGGQTNLMQNLRMLAMIQQQQARTQNFSNLISMLQQPQQPEPAARLPQVQPVQIPTFNVHQNPYIMETQNTLNVCFLETSSFLFLSFVFILINCSFCFVLSQNINAGKMIGDTQLQLPMSNGLIYPKAYGSYMEFDEDIKLTDVQEWTMNYKQEMRNEWTTKTNTSILSQEVHKIIDKINNKNLAGFLFHDSMKETFQAPDDDDWIYLMFVPKINNPSLAALTLQGDAQQWNKDEWDKKYCDKPPFHPTNEQITAIKNKLANVICKGYLFVDSDSNTNWYITDESYKGRFEPRQWRAKQKNDSVYMCRLLDNGVEKVPKTAKKNSYYFELKTEQVE